VKGPRGLGEREKKQEKREIRKQRQSGVVQRKRGEKGEISKKRETVKKKVHERGRYYVLKNTKGDREEKKVEQGEGGDKRK